MKNWPFRDEPNTMAITTRSIIHKREPILSVWHDEDDGMWQFLGSAEPNESDAVLVSLEEILSLDITVAELCELPLGWVAWRESAPSTWNFQKQE